MGLAYPRGLLPGAVRLQGWVAFASLVDIIESKHEFDKDGALATASWRRQDHRRRPEPSVRDMTSGSLAQPPRPDPAHDGLSIVACSAPVRGDLRIILNGSLAVMPPNQHQLHAGPHSSVPCR